MSATQKRLRFISEPMTSKLVTELPGIGQVYGNRLSKNGYPMARDVFAQYLFLRGDEAAFRNFMDTNGGVTDPRSVTDCYEALKDWSQHFL
ncbi:Barrier to autointegration factor [Popillia japonica]|uniref:Barrier to autointegration factor n=1 Tax=Popillia japonica TaxID=7064 RepID=A0AAW1JKU7_POPJA